MMFAARLFADHALLFLTGSTALLFVGCALMATMRSPAHRQRTGEITVAVTLGWLALACLPLPRILPETFWSGRFWSERFIVERPLADDQPGKQLAASSPLAEQFALDDRSIDAESDLGRTRMFGEEITVELPTDRIDLQTAGDPHIADYAARQDATAPEAMALPPIVAVYLGGAAVCIAWFGCGLVRLSRIRRAARRPPLWLAELFESLSESCDKRPLLLVSARCPRPISWGVWRPVIVLPLKLARRSHREQIRMVLLHELGHIARRDSRGNLLLCLALPWLYVHPLFWWVRSQVRLAAELLADDWAAQRTDKLAYVAQLVALARSSPAKSASLAGAFALYSSPSQFYRRMQMLISRNGPLLPNPSIRWRLCSLAAGILVVVMAVVSAGVRPAVGQQPKAEVAAPAAEAALPAPTASSDKAAPATEAQPAGKTAGAEEPADPLQRLPIVGRLFATADEAAEVQAQDADEQVLRAKLAAAQQQIRALEEQLKVLGAQRSKGDAKQSPPAGANAEPKSNTVTLTRVNEDGSITLENWTTDEEGRPAKIVWKKVTHSTADSPIAEAKPAAVKNGQVFKEYRTKDGSVVMHVYDRATGKLMETRTSAGEIEPALPETANTLANARHLATSERAPEKPQSPSGAVERGSVGGLDVVSLATAYADAISAVETAQAGLAAAEEAAANKTISAHEVNAARLAVRSAQRKYELLRNIASVAADAAKSDLQRVQQLVRAGAASTGVVAESDSRWKMLNAILQSGPGEQAKEGLLGLPAKTP